jgi:hypothetical protein
MLESHTYGFPNLALRRSLLNLCLVIFLGPVNLWGTTRSGERACSFIYEVMAFVMILFLYIFASPGCRMLSCFIPKGGVLMLMGSRSFLYACLGSWKRKRS